MSIKNLALSLLLTSSTPALGHTTIRDGHLPIPVDGTQSSKTRVFSLIGTEWQATEIEGAPLVPTDRGDLTVFFDSETLSGFGGCNGFRTEWENIIDSTGPAMFRSIGPFVPNRVFCGEAIIDQERTFIGAFRGSTAYSVSEDGEELVIYATAMGDDDEDTSEDAPHSFLHVGRPLVRLTRIPTLDTPEEDYRDEPITNHFGDEVWENAHVDIDEEAEEGSSDDTEVDNSIFSLEDSSWQLTEVRGFAAIDDGSLPVTLSFSSDATSISGFDGCNRFNGPMDLLFGIDSLPSFRMSGPIRATRAGCRDNILDTQARMFRGVLRSDPVIYTITQSKELIELELYEAEVDNNGRQTQGELLARFTRIEEGDSW
jgi:heat shock protein HslJ